MAATKIATQRLFIGYALAHNVGDSVPAENVGPNGWGDGVANEGTKAADEARGYANNPEPPATNTASPAPK